MGIFLKLCISINSNGASVDRTAETREPLQIDKLRVILYTVHNIMLSYQTNKVLAKRIQKGRTMDKNNIPVITCMCSGMIIGLAIGGVVGLAQGRAGITMCYGILFGMIIGVIIGTVIKKVKEKE